MNYFTVFKYDDNLYQIKDALGVLSTLVIGNDKALLFEKKLKKLQRNH